MPCGCAAAGRQATGSTSGGGSAVVRMHACIARDLSILVSVYSKLVFGDPCRRRRRCMDSHKVAVVVVVDARVATDRFCRLVVVEKEAIGCCGT